MNLFKKISVTLMILFAAVIMMACEEAAKPNSMGSAAPSSSPSSPVSMLKYVPDWGNFENSDKDFYDSPVTVYLNGGRNVWFLFNERYTTLIDYYMKGFSGVLDRRNGTEYEVLFFGDKMKDVVKKLRNWETQRLYATCVLTFTINRVNPADEKKDTLTVEVDYREWKNNELKEHNCVVETVNLNRLSD